MDKKLINISDFNNTIKTIAEVYAPGKHTATKIEIANHSSGISIVFSVYIADHIPYWSHKDHDELISKIRTYFADPNKNQENIELNLEF